MYGGQARSARPAYFWMEVRVGSLRLAHPALAAGHYLPAGGASSLVFLLPPRRSADSIPDNFRQITHQPLQRMLYATEVLREVVNLAFNPIETRFNRSEIVAVAPALFENMARDQLFALDFAFKGLEFLSGHMRRHRLIPSGPVAG